MRRDAAQPAELPRRPPLRPVISIGNVSLAADRQRRVVKTSERLAIEIVRDIVAQGLRTGDHLPLEAAMVERYHVSRASVREALRLLEMQGLISLKPGPGGGPVVGAVEPANLARTASLYFHLGAATYGQLMEAQVLLEPLCARLAANHPERAAAMTPYFDDIAVPDEPRYREHTIGFHRTVWELAANPVVSLLSQAVTHLVSHHVVATMDPVEMRQDILDDHAALARVIADGDGDKAASMMAGHFQEQHDFYRVHWPARLAELIEWR
jgi:GntR family transcriptional repressor for pyruvate dehydrogenase complex